MSVIWLFLRTEVTIKHPVSVNQVCPKMWIWTGKPDTSGEKCVKFDRGV